MLKFVKIIDFMIDPFFIITYYLSISKSKTIEFYFIVGLHYFVDNAFDALQPTPRRLCAGGGDTKLLAGYQLSCSH
jgi:hypothetical protein